MIAFIFFGGTADKAIREYTARELGFTDAGENALVECRQRYFHIWFLPFFPLGKFWVLKKGNEWYPLSKEQEKEMERRAEIPATPLYMWAGAVVVPLTIILFLLIKGNFSDR
jgi:hypothetical protein